MGVVRTVWCAVIVLIIGDYVKANDRILLCYHGSWSTYRLGLGQFGVQNINPDLCTHLIYSFAGIDDTGALISLDPYLDLPDGRDNYRAFNRLKEQNPELKTLLAVGGWSEGSAKYSVMAADATKRQAFIQSALSFLQTYGFDGLDLDWEYPNKRDTVHGIADIDNFSTLIMETKAAFQIEGYLLTAAVSAVESSAQDSYDIPTISQYLDFVHLMTYDMNGAWDPTTGHNAPLHRGEGDDNTPRESAFTVDVSVEYWLSQGCPKEKLIMGLPFYGRTFHLTSDSNTAVRAPANGPGTPGPYTQEAGIIGYNEFCAELLTGQWIQFYDNLALVPYAAKGSDWVTYDSPDSITTKVEYAKSMGLGGVMVWSIETDDFQGVCGDTYPLLRAINAALVSSSDPGNTGTTTTVSTTTTIATVIPTPKPTAVCTGEGITANPEDCATFYYCVRNVDGTITAFKFSCPAGLWFDSSTTACNYKELTECSV